MGGSLSLSSYSLQSGRRATTIATATFPATGYPEASLLREEFPPLLPGHGTMADRTYPALGVAVLPVTGVSPEFALPAGAVTIGAPAWNWSTREVDPGQRMRRGSALMPMEDAGVVGMMLNGGGGDELALGETFAVCSAYVLDTLMAISAEEPDQPDAQMMGMWVPPGGASYADTTGFGTAPAAPGSTLVAQIPFAFSNVPDTTIFKINVTMVRWFDVNGDGSPMPVSDTDGDGTADDGDDDDDGDGVTDGIDDDDDGDGFADDNDPGIDDLMFCDRSSRTTVTVVGPSGLPTDVAGWHNYEELGEIGEISLLLLLLLICLLTDECPLGEAEAEKVSGPEIERVAELIAPVLDWAGISSAPLAPSGGGTG